jgi:excisionase family DNA binding protein
MASVPGRGAPRPRRTPQSGPAPDRSHVSTPPAAARARRPHQAPATSAPQKPSQSRSAHPLMTAGQVAELLGVPRSWVYEQSRLGRIPTVSLGRYRRYRRRGDRVLGRGAREPGDGASARQARALTEGSRPASHRDRGRRDRRATEQAAPAGEENGTKLEPGQLCSRLPRSAPGLDECRATAGELRYPVAGAHRRPRTTT